MGWLVAVAFLGAVVSAVAVAVFGAAQQTTKDLTTMR
ncbi:Uncharacterised protein [Mycobacteroides abscessus]|nr:Uncharacterised protein [Mycobacteroides abscessus]SKT66297.1 Uncharacterised protein [Mycobacteroides abscessus subsp. abscessus]